MKALQNLKRLSWLLVLWFSVIGLGMVGWFVETNSANPETVLAATPTPVPTPAFTLSPGAEPPLYSAKGVWLYERTTGSLLYTDNAEEATAVASLAKLMTALVAYESYDLKDELPIGSASAVLGNRAKFLSRDYFSVADLIRSMLVFSANDAAQALANGLGSNNEFVNRMNGRAQGLELQNTHFVNSFGIDHPQQYSSAADIGKLAHEVLAVPFLEDAVAQQKVLVRERRTGRTDVIYSTNSLLRLSDHYRGVKTGTTDQAGESLVVRYIDDNEAMPKKIDLLLVILGSENRYQDAQKLIKWALEEIQTNQETTQAFSG